jgi:predicted transposase YdaD
METYEWQSDFARKYVAIGREQCREEGQEEGREEGRILGAAEDVILVLGARGFTVPDEVRDRIESCTDLETLRKWVPAAATVDRPEDLFD